LLVYVVVHIVSRGFGFSKAVFLKLLILFRYQTINYYDILLQIHQ